MKRAGLTWKNQLNICIVYLVCLQGVSPRSSTDIIACACCKMAARELPASTCLGSFTSATGISIAPQVCLQHVPIDSTNSFLHELYTQQCVPVHWPTNSLLSIEVQTDDGPTNVSDEHNDPAPPLTVSA